MTVEVDKGPCLGLRHVQALLLFFAITSNYIARLNISVAVVAMTNAETTNPDFDEYDWTGKEISYILSSFSWGYVITQFPGGYMARRFGAKLTMLISTLGSSVFAIITPFCIPFGGWQIFCGIRVMQGLFQGLLFPAMHAHLAMWSPPEERNRLGAMSQSGIDCGTLMAMLISGLIASSSLGWPGISYMSGLIGLVWCVFWVLFSSNSPSESRWITDKESMYIIASQKKNEVGGEKKIPVPWKALLTSVPFWALTVTRFSSSWGFSTLQAEVPSYMNGVLMMDIKENTLYSSLPYLAMWIMSYVCLLVSEVLLKKQWLSLTGLRRTFNSISFWGSAVGLIGIGFLEQEQKTLAVVLMTLVIAVNSGSTIGSILNTIDLSPNHAGIQMGIINTGAGLVTIVTPLVVGAIVVDEHSRGQWQIVFIITAAVYALGNLVYILFGSTDLQPWDDEHFLEKHKKDDDIMFKERRETIQVSC